MFTTQQVLKKLSLLAFISLLLFLSSGTASTQTCPDNMTHYWKLNETGSPTSFFDSYVGTNNAACGTSCPAPAAGILDGGQLFDGSNDEINAPDTFVWGAEGSFSIEFWMNTSTILSSGVDVMVSSFVKSSVQCWVGYDDNEQARFFLQDSSTSAIDIEGGPVINDDVWHHIVAVRNGLTDENILYVDGKVAAGPANQDYLNGFGSTTALSIGHMNNSFGYTGILDEIALYNRALTLSEIELHYNATSGAEYCSGCQNDAECDDGNMCNGNETCDANACQPGTPLVCDNSLWCDGTETCNSSTGCEDNDDPCLLSMCDERNDLCLECLSDVDCDGICNPGASNPPDCTGSDNCPSTPNGPDGGTCISGTIRKLCLSDSECDLNPGDGFCSMDQEDDDGDGTGDACGEIVCSCDVSGDGTITPQDALCAFEKYLLICPTSCGPCEEICCDVNDDTQCTPADALCVFLEYLEVGCEHCN